MIAQLLKDLKGRDVHLGLTPSGRLRLDAPRGVLSEGLLNRIKEAREDLQRHLATDQRRLTGKSFLSQRWGPAGPSTQRQAVEVELRRLVKRLAAAGATFMVNPDGRFIIDENLGAEDGLLIEHYPHAFRNALAKAGLYRIGMLDQLYGLDLDELGLTPPADPELRAVYLTWDEERRRRFSKADIKYHFEGLGRHEAERRAAEEVLEELC